jgi:hypothetical protein
MKRTLAILSFTLMLSLVAFGQMPSQLRAQIAAACTSCCQGGCDGCCKGKCPLCYHCDHTM